MEYAIAKKVLKTFISNMQQEDCDFSYAAIVKQIKNHNTNYVIEYGNISGKKLYDEANINPQQLVEYTKTGSINYKASNNFLLRGQSVNNAEAELLNNGLQINAVRAKFRPLVAGVSVSDSISSSKSGTLGALFNLKTRKGYYGISNMHVLSFYQTKPSHKNIQTFRDEIVVQPSKTDNSNLGLTEANTRIGKIIWKALNEEVDAAIFKIDDEVEVDGRFFNNNIQLHYDAYITPEINWLVEKCGRTTGRQSGIILSVDAAVRIKNPFTKQYVVLKDQIMTNYVADGGDSGSMLYRKFNETNAYAVGLTFAKINSKKQQNIRIFHNKIANIFNNITDFNSNPIVLDYFIKHNPKKHDIMAKQTLIDFDTTQKTFIKNKDHKITVSFSKWTRKKNPIREAIFYWDPSSEPLNFLKAIVCKSPNGDCDYHLVLFCNIKDGFEQEDDHTEALEWNFKHDEVTNCVLVTYSNDDNHVPKPNEIDCETYYSILEGKNNDDDSIIPDTDNGGIIIKQ